jgi:serine/threonine-protein phosphatase Stp1
MTYCSASRSHVGGRLVNEDRVLDAADIGLWAVADGMGGHRDGAAAASGLIEALRDADHCLSGYERLTDMIERAKGINAVLFNAAASSKVSGTTLVALLAHEKHYACVWAGDSRAYVMRANVLVPITKDHSVVQYLIDRGEVAEVDRHKHPQAHVITRAVGVAPAMELEQRFDTLRDGDRFLLCSDGLSCSLQDDEIAQLMREPDLDQAADTLMAAALSRSPRDNISFVLIASGIQAPSERGAASSVGSRPFQPRL